MENMMQRSANINTLEHKNAANEREKFIRKLLIGGAVFNPKKSAELGIRMQSSRFSVILARISLSADAPHSDVPEIMYAIRNIGEELYGAYSECYGIDVDAVTVGFLCCHGENSDFIAEQSADLKRHINELFGLNTTMSLCTRECSVDDCGRLYKNARYAMLYRLSFTPYSIINYDETLSMSRLSCEYPALLEREVFECIRSRDEASLKRAVSAFIGTIDNMSYDTIVLHTTRLLLAVDGLAVSEKRGTSRFTTALSRI